MAEDTKVRCDRCQRLVSRDDVADTTGTIYRGAGHRFRVEVFALLGQSLCPPCVADVVLARFEITVNAAEEN